MKRLIAVLWMISTLAVGIVWAQSFPPNEAGVTMGHWHLNTRDIEANKKIFVAVGGTAIIVPMPVSIDPVATQSVGITELEALYRNDSVFRSRSAPRTAWR